MVSPYAESFGSFSVEVGLTKCNVPLSHREQRLRIETLIFAAGGPDERTQFQLCAVKIKDIDEIAELAPPGEGEHLVDCQIVWMEHIPELVVRLNREESERGIVTPAQAK